MSASPRISILTPCLNGARYLKECVDSVQLQGYPDFEHIVADGGSDDGSLPLLARYPGIKTISAPDRGIYDALNRALALASGGIIGILNCDDRYATGIFAAVADAFRNDQVMAVAGEAISFREMLSDSPIPEEHYSPAGTDPMHMAILGTPAINAWFFRAAAFTRLGSFDADFRIAGDREFLLRFALGNMPYVELGRLVCCYRKHLASLTFAGNEPIWYSVLREHHRMTSMYLQRSDLDGRARELLKRARSRDSLQGAIYSGRRGEMREFFFHAAAGTRHDLLWPLRLARRAARELSVSVRLHGAGAST
jgi:glycosyltransferase involved in cell wall biosynthesis